MDIQLRTMHKAYENRVIKNLNVELSVFIKTMSTVIPEVKCKDLQEFIFYDKGLISAMIEEESCGVKWDWKSPNADEESFDEEDSIPNIVFSTPPLSNKVREYEEEINDEEEDFSDLDGDEPDEITGSTFEVAKYILKRCHLQDIFDVVIDENKCPAINRNSTTKK